MNELNSAPLLPVYELDILLQVPATMLLLPPPVAVKQLQIPPTITSVSYTHLTLPTIYSV